MAASHSQLPILGLGHSPGSEEVRWRGNIWLYCDQHRVRWFVYYSRPRLPVDPPEVEATAERIKDYTVVTPVRYCDDVEMERYYPGYGKFPEDVKQLLKDHALSKCPNVV